MARKRLITVEEGILVHLLGFIKLQPGDTVPMEMTQAGISRAIGVRRSHVSLSLETARQRGTAEEHLSRVKWEKRKRKCYFLTPAGMEQARDLQARLPGIAVEAQLADGTAYSGTMDGLLARLGPGHGLARTALLYFDGVIAVPQAVNGESDGGPQGTVPDAGKVIGRGRELAALKKLFDGEARIATVAGMPGIGKTSLVARAAAQFGGARVFWFAVREWSSPRNASGHLARYLCGLGSPRLLRYLENHENPDTADIHDILLDQGQEAILVFDDCHKAGPEMRSFLDMLAGACNGNTRLSTCLISRQPDLLAGFGDYRESILRLNLAPLDEDASKALLAGRGFAEEPAARIARRSGGHPLYLMLAGPDGGEESAKDIEAMLAREIDATVSESGRALLQMLSVYREPVSRDAVVESAEEMALLDGLTARSIVSESGGLSMHGIVREFYYSRQAPADRRLRHEKAAEFYNRRSGGHNDLAEEIHHLFMADDKDSAVMALVSGGPGLLAHGYVDEVLAFCDMVPDGWRNAGEMFGVSFIRGSALDLIGRWADACGAYARCLDLSETLQDDEKRAETLRRLGAIQYRRGEMTGARGTFETALSIAGTRSVIAELQGSLGVVLWKLGDVPAARDAHATDLRISGEENDPRGISRALNNLGILDWQSGDYATALERYSEALTHAERVPDRKLIAIIYSNIGDVHRSTNRPAEARRYYERCLELAEDLKFNWQVAEAYRGLADVVPERRNDYLSRALNIFDRLGAIDDAKTVRGMMSSGKS